MRAVMTALFVGALVVALTAGSAYAQAPAGKGGGGGQGMGPGGRPPRGGGGGPGGFSIDTIKERIGATDDEWAVIKPKLENVIAKQRATSTFPPRQGRNRGGAAGGAEETPAAPAVPETPVLKAAADLRTTLADPNATTDQIKEKLTAFRAAREKARAELTAAQEELKTVLSVKQEAQLVLMGNILE